MRQNKTIASCAVALSALVVASCTTGGDSKGKNVIDIAQAVANPVEMKVSDLGKTIRYVPLETTDSSLVGDSWVLTPADGAVLISNVNNGGLEAEACLSFGLDGKFISGVGHYGQDPEAYRSSECVIAPDNKSAYFAASNGMQHYSIDGQYLGKTCRAGMIGMPGVTVAVDTMFIAVEDGLVGKDSPRCFSIYSEGFNTFTVDTVEIIPYPKDATKGWYYSNVSISRVDGVMRNAKNVYREYDEGGNITYRQGYLRTVWRVGQTVHHRELLSDTIYAITPASAEVAYVFDCGDDHITAELIAEQKGLRSNTLFVSDIVETNYRMIFGASRGWLGSEGNRTFVGIYDKNTGATRAGDGAKGFVDDLAGFMPFYPLAALPDGSLVGVITMDDVAKYTEENPEAKIPAEIAALEEDANPILVIVGN